MLHINQALETLLENQNLFSLLQELNSVVGSSTMKVADKSQLRRSRLLTYKKFTKIAKKTGI
jgi:hypothetical protein